MSLFLQIWMQPELAATCDESLKFQTKSLQFVHSCHAKEELKVSAMVLKNMVEYLLHVCQKD